MDRERKAKIKRSFPPEPALENIKSRRWSGGLSRNTFLSKYEVVGQDSGRSSSQFGRHGARCNPPAREQYEVPQWGSHRF